MTGNCCRRRSLTEGKIVFMFWNVKLTASFEESLATPVKKKCRRNSSNSHRWPTNQSFYMSDVPLQFLVIHGQQCNSPLLQNIYLSSRLIHLETRCWWQACCGTEEQIFPFWLEHLEEGQRWCGQGDLDASGPVGQKQEETVSVWFTIEWDSLSHTH